MKNNVISKKLLRVLGVGKTTLIMKYLNFRDLGYTPSVFEIVDKKITFHNRELIINIWDTRMGEMYGIKKF